MPVIGAGEASICVCKRKYSHLTSGDLRHVRQLEEENARPKRVVADLTLDKHILQSTLRPDRLRRGKILRLESSGVGPFVCLEMVSERAYPCARLRVSIRGGRVPIETSSARSGTGNERSQGGLGGTEEETSLARKVDRNVCADFPVLRTRLQR